jgi:hypothetical protein
VANNWPAHPDPLEDLAKLHSVSLRAQEYDPVVIDLHINVHPEISLLTPDQLLTERHRHQTTPHFSSVTREAAHMLGLGTLALQLAVSYRQLMLQPELPLLRQLSI